MTLIKEDDLFHEAIEKLPPNFKVVCPIYDQPYNSHNYHEFVWCLDRLNELSKVMRHGRNGYGHT